MCKYTFIKYAGDKGQAERTGGALFSTECGNTIYGLELSKGNCIYCGQQIVCDNNLLAGELKIKE